MSWNIVKDYLKPTLAECSLDDLRHAAKAAVSAQKDIFTDEIVALIDEQSSRVAIENVILALYVCTHRTENAKINAVAVAVSFLFVYVLLGKKAEVELLLEEKCEFHVSGPLKKHRIHDTYFDKNKKVYKAAAVSKPKNSQLFASKNLSVVEFYYSAFHREINASLQRRAGLQQQVTSVKEILAKKEELVLVQVLANMGL